MSTDYTHMNELGITINTPSKDEGLARRFNQGYLDLMEHFGMRPRTIQVDAQSRNRIQKERAIRKHRLRRLLGQLNELGQRKRLTRDELLMKLGVARKEAGRNYRLLEITVPEQLKAMQMIDVLIPTVDGRWLNMSRHTRPDKAQQLSLAQLHMELPPQPPPEITSEQFTSSCGEDL
jgi:hypothetical protein